MSASGLNKYNISLINWCPMIHNWDILNNSVFNETPAENFSVKLNQRKTGYSITKY